MIMKLAKSSMTTRSICNLWIRSIFHIFHKKKKSSSRKEDALRPEHPGVFGQIGFSRQDLSLMSILPPPSHNEGTGFTSSQKHRHTSNKNRAEVHWNWLCQVGVSGRPVPPPKSGGKFSFTKHEKDKKGGTQKKENMIRNTWNMSLRWDWTMHCVFSFDRKSVSQFVLIVATHTFARAFETANEILLHWLRLNEWHEVYNVIFAFEALRFYHMLSMGVGLVLVRLAGFEMEISSKKREKELATICR